MYFRWQWWLINHSCVYCSTIKYHMSRPLFSSLDFRSLRNLSLEVYKYSRSKLVPQWRNEWDFYFRNPTVTLCFWKMVTMVTFEGGPLFTVSDLAAFNTVWPGKYILTKHCRSLLECSYPVVLPWYFDILYTMVLNDYLIQVSCTWYFHCIS